MAEIALSSCSMCAPASPTRMYPNGTRISSVYVRTSPSFSLETRSTLRTVKLRPSRLFSTERRIFSTTTFQPSLTISSKSPSSGFSADLSGKPHTLFINTNVYSDPNLTLVEAPVLQPSEIAIDQDQIQNMNKELEEAANMDLPEGEGDDDF